MAVRVEAIEPRLFLDASELTVMIDSSTLPSAVSDRRRSRGRCR